MYALSAREKAEVVEQYLQVPHGQKMRWLEARGISECAVARWKRAYFFGDLERGLVPRDTSGMGLEGARMQELVKQLAAERAERIKEQQRHEEEVARLRAVNDALGKAIGLLHDRAAKPEPTDEP